MFLAFDLGASSGRALLGRLDGDRLDAEELHRFPTPILEQGGRLTWDAEALWAELREGLSRALRAAPGLRSLSVTSWGVDYVPLGEDGTPLRDPYCYRDPRHAGMMARAFERVPREALYEATGIQLLEINSLYQLLADRELEPERFAATARRLPIADYFNYRFSGRIAAERSLASTTQCLDVRTREWSAELLARLGLPADAWSPIVPSGTRLGRVRPGLVDGAEDVEVVASCSHDTACAVVAVPAEADVPWAYVSCGSWSLLGVERAEPLVTPAACEAGFTNEAGLDDTIRFLKNLNGLWVLQECERAWRERGEAPPWERLLEEARAARPLGYFLDLNDPAFALRGDMPETVRREAARRGVPPESRGALVRLVLESLAHSYAETLRTLEALTGSPAQVLHLVGGGARNPLLCQWSADACRLPVVAGPVEATAVGNLLVQARAMGALPPGLAPRDVVRASFPLQHYLPESNPVFARPPFPHIS